jgi:hypothetical protein
MQRQAVYVDLFDDGLFGPALPFNRTYDDLKNHIRLVCLSHLLLNEVIVVPEQWLCSSAACIDVLGEIAAGYLKHYDDSVGGENLAEHPIALSLFERDAALSGVDGRMRFLAALYERSLKQHRFRIHASVEERDGEGRRRFSELMKGRLDMGVNEVVGDKRLRGQLTDLLGEGSGRRAGNLVSLIRYAVEIAPQGPASPWAGYQRQILGYGERIEDVFRDLSHHQPVFCEPYLAFFDAMRRDRVPFTDLGKMANIVMSVGAQEQMGSLASIVRQGMHVSLSQTTRAGTVALSYNAYEAPTGSFEKTLVQGVLPSFDAKVEHFEYTSILQRSGSDGPVLDAGQDWVEIWRAFFNRCDHHGRSVLKARLDRANAARLESGAPDDVGPVLEIYSDFIEGLEGFTFSAGGGGALRAEVKGNGGHVALVGQYISTAGAGISLALPALGALVSALGAIVTTGGQTHEAGTLKRVRKRRRPRI